MNTRHRTGFTVLEVLIVVFISLILIAALLRFLSAGHPLARVTYLQAQATETARLQLKRLVKMIREARPSDTGAYPLVAALPQKIVFYANIDSDAATELVRFELVDTKLERGVIQPTGTPSTYDSATEVTTTIATSVRNGAQDIFTYYDGSYPANTTPLAPTDLTEVKYVQLSLVIDADPLADPLPITVRSQVQLRNLKTNLAEEL